MTDYTPPSNGEPFENLETVLATIAHSLVAKGRLADADIFSSANIFLEYTDYDNWDGGTLVWNLCIEIPYPSFVAYSDKERKQLESFIDLVIKPFLPEMGHWVNSKFKTLPFNDSEWRKNIRVGKDFKTMSAEFEQTEFEQVSQLARLLTTYSTGGEVSNDDFSKLRYELLSNNQIANLLPGWLKIHRNLDSFWGFIQPKYGSYSERRKYLAEQFSPALNFLEFGHTEEMKKTTEVFTNAGSSIYENVKNKKKVFIVHGRDNEAKQEISRYIESLNLEAIVLHEQVSSGMTIIEKIEHYSDETSFALVLYTACDHGRGVNESKVHPRNRARQNVVFEHGYLMAKLGRKNVCALVKGDIETPNDISGVIYVNLDQAGAWKMEVFKELEDCGYQIQ